MVKFVADDGKLLLVDGLVGCVAGHVVKCLCSQNRGWSGGGKRRLAFLRSRVDTKGSKLRPIENSLV